MLSLIGWGLVFIGIIFMALGILKIQSAYKRRNADYEALIRILEAMNTELDQAILKNANENAILAQMAEASETQQQVGN